MGESPVYLDDTPSGDDAIGVHTKLADAVSQIITDQDVSDGSFTLGIYGEWGSGKSFILREVQEKIAGISNIACFEIDVWKYIDSALYRNILYDLDNQLRETKDVALKEFKNKGYFYNGRKAYGKKKSLDELLELSHTRAKNIKKQSSDESRGSQRNSIWSRIWRAITQEDNIRAVGVVTVGIAIPAIVFLLISGTDWYIRNNDLAHIIGVILLSLWSYFFGTYIKEKAKDYYNSTRSLEETTVISQPSFSQDQFEEIFENLKNQVLRCLEKGGKPGSGKMVIIFDNLDRCDAKLAVQTLTGLQTFLDRKQCFYIIPCDDGRIKEHLGRGQQISTKSAYLDKIFTSYIRMPRVESYRIEDFYENCLKDSNLDEVLSQDEQQFLKNVVLSTVKSVTPREIKRFLNDLISYWRIAEAQPDLRLNDNFHLLAFMVAVKQNWPWVEKDIANNPDLLHIAKSDFPEFKKSYESGSTDQLKFLEFVKSTVEYLDLNDVNLLNYVYLHKSEINQNKLNSILIRNEQPPVLTLDWLGSVEKFISLATRKEDFYRLTRTTDRMIEIYSERIDDLEKELSVEQIKFLAIIWNAIQTREDLLVKQSKDVPRGAEKYSGFLIQNGETIQSKVDNQYNQVLSEWLCQIGPKDSIKELFEHHFIQDAEYLAESIFNRRAEGHPLGVQERVKFAKFVGSHLEKYVEEIFVQEVVRELSIDNEHEMSIQVICELPTDLFSEELLQTLQNELGEYINLTQNSPFEDLDNSVSDLFIWLIYSGQTWDAWPELDKGLYAKVSASKSSEDKGLYCKMVWVLLVLCRTENIVRGISQQLGKRNGFIGTHEVVEALIDEFDSEGLRMLVDLSAVSDQFLSNLKSQNKIFILAERLDLSEVQNDKFLNFCSVEDFGQIVGALCDSEDIQSVRQLFKWVESQKKYGYLRNLNLQDIGVFSCTSAFRSQFFKVYGNVLSQDLNHFKAKMGELSNDSIIKGVYKTWLESNYERVFGQITNGQDAELYRFFITNLGATERYKLFNKLLGWLEESTREHNAIKDKLRIMQAMLDSLDWIRYNTINKNGWKFIHRCLEPNRNPDVQLWGLNVCSEFLDEGSKLRRATVRKLKELQDSGKHEHVRLEAEELISDHSI